MFNLVTHLNSHVWSTLGQKGLNYTNIATYDTVQIRKVKLLLKDFFSLQLTNAGLESTRWVISQYTCISDWSSFLYETTKWSHNLYYNCQL